MASEAKLGDAVKNVPNALIYAVAGCFVAIVAAFVVLAVTSSNSADLRSFLNTILNIAGALFGGGSVLFSAAAAKSARSAEVQTNGKLSEKEEQIAELQAKLDAKDVQ